MLARVAVVFSFFGRGCAPAFVGWGAAVPPFNAGTLSFEDRLVRGSSRAGSFLRDDFLVRGSFDFCGYAGALRWFGLLFDNCIGRKRNVDGGVLAGLS